MPEIPEGVVASGWPYVIAAYSITAAVLMAYTWSLFLRMKKTAEEDSE